MSQMILLMLMLNFEFTENFLHYLEKYKTTASRLSSWMENNIPEGLTVFSLSENQREKLRSTNMVERLNKEIKRRTRVAPIFPNEGSLLRLVSAILVKTSEEWETGQMYLPIVEE